MGIITIAEYIQQKHYPELLIDKIVKCIIESIDKFYECEFTGKVKSIPKGLL
jgi:hypothetical protein